MSTRPLGILKNIVDSAGMDISYAYEDLVFLEHNSFMFQFTEVGNEVLVHINSEADSAAVAEDISRLQSIAAANKITLLRGDFYTLIQDDEENIRIEFKEGE